VLEIRIVAPSHLTSDITAMLDEHPGVVTIALMRGSSLIPVGDTISVGVVREAGDDVIGRLRSLGVAEQGTLTVVEPRLVLSNAATTTEAHVPGSPIDAVIWEEVSNRTSEDASMSGTYLILMMAATMIAGIGVLSDSVILIVAAMVVGPDFGPTAATAVGIASRRWTVARSAFFTLIVGFLTGIAATALLAGFLHLTGIYQSQAVLGLRPQTAFIYEVGWPSVIIAMIAGVVGMISLTTAKSGALIGVFISVTTIPAAANVAVALVYRIPDEVIGSMQQLLVNIVAIQVAAGLTLLIQRRLTSRANDHLRVLLRAGRAGTIAS